MKWLITGLNGTLAPQVPRAATAAQIEVVSWNRSEVNPDDHCACGQWLNKLRVDAILHLAMGSAEWAGQKRGMPLSLILRFCSPARQWCFIANPTVRMR
jgi:hypothetical protein